MLYFYYDHERLVTDSCESMGPSLNYVIDVLSAYTTKFPSVTHIYQLSSLLQYFNKFTSTSTYNAFKQFYGISDTSIDDHEYSEQFFIYITIIPHCYGNTCENKCIYTYILVKLDEHKTRTVCNSKGRKIQKFDQFIENIIENTLEDNIYDKKFTTIINEWKTSLLKDDKFIE